ncbi:hypothetical protein GCM10011502_26790 [Oceanisphaera marina]|uniref:Schlafen AlbA-2 domain-containing protein n=1 Tax=Oceanisphaera marina TaxID=2017550 RepID=A0ABQ1IVU7_9GAMM|nr:RNA-binding domain-containing protein [Oceanisphaera marina]GGB52260.1 hypothetical protein GCM10011502_26790 [Oceanisphaera marina]
MPTVKLTTTPNWLLDLAESCELECKKAAGRNGKGEIPKDFWPTVSAFANTRGGTILLGIEEEPIGQFRVSGIAEPERLLTELFNILNNPQKISRNQVDDSDVEILEVDGKKIIKVQIRPASRYDKPVYVGENPMRGTYRRLHEGDRRCSAETVRRMQAEQVEDERDSRILKGFSMVDIDKRSLSIFRQMLRDAKGAGHPFLSEDDQGLLLKLRGWRKDRESGQEGLTLAGVLMFGTWEAIQEAAPYYFVDYQERPEAKTENRWVDRVYPDGSWSGNLFDFYRITYGKLTNPESLKIPFKLNQGQRQDDTPVHEAIREALVNTIVHADYTERVSVLVVKRPDMMGFRNPGTMRIPLEQAVQGGISDCRNRIIHQMFLMIGIGERAGSGVPKIYSGWNWRHWRTPALREIDEPAQTLLELRMLELMPAGILEQLENMFSDRFTRLPLLERQIMAAAATEQVVSHKRIVEICPDHSHDITLALRDLVQKGLLEISGQGRGAVYFIPGQNLPTPELVFGGIGLLKINSDDNGVSSNNNGVSSDDNGVSSNDNGVSSNDNGESSDDNGESSDDNGESSDDNEQNALDNLGRLLSNHLPAPVVHDLQKLEPDLLRKLQEQAIAPQLKQRVKTGLMRQILLTLCDGHYVTRSCLALLVNRDSDSLRQQYLTPLVRKGYLLLAFPQNPTHPKQAYMKSDKPLSADDEKLFSA